jgi:hypothetical protein
VHIGDDFRAGLQLRSGRYIRLVIENTEVSRTLLCEQCLRDFSISDDISDLPFEETLDKYPALDTPELFCGKCFQERLDDNLS